MHIQTSEFQYELFGNWSDIEKTYGGIGPTDSETVQPPQLPSAAYALEEREHSAAQTKYPSFNIRPALNRSESDSAAATPSVPCE